MKILIVAAFFPPANSIASVRTGKMAAYFQEQGHDVRIITAHDVGYPETLECPIAEEAIIRCEWFNFNQALRILKNKIIRKENVYKENQRSTNSSGEVRSPAKRIYSSLTAIPDFCWTWIRPAKKAGNKLFNSWKPDIIYASGGPFSSFFVAKYLATKINIPWVAEYRDLWSNNDYYPHISLRQKLDIFLEKSVCKSACAVTTVSDHLGHLIRESGDPFTYKQIEIIMNGYDEKDYAEGMYQKSDSQNLNLVYTGNIYIDKGRHKPQILFKALQLLRDDIRSNVTITFYRRGMDFIRDIAMEYGVEDRIILAGEVEFKEAVKQQQLSDILVYLLWNGPQADGTFSAKLFEYAGAGRPILAIGDKITGAVCTLICDQKLGYVYSDEQQIADFLTEKVIEKQKTGMIQAPPKEARLSLRRQIQFSKLEDLLEQHVQKDK